MSVQTINAYGIKIAEALEVIEFEEQTKNNLPGRPSEYETSYPTSLLGKRKQPEPYSPPSLIDQLRGLQP
jgi:hypothetical protein